MHLGVYAAAACPPRPLPAAALLAGSRRARPRLSGVRRAHCLTVVSRLPAATRQFELEIGAQLLRLALRSRIGPAPTPSRPLAPQRRRSRLWIGRRLRRSCQRRWPRGCP